MKSETMQQLESTIQSIIENYALVDRIHSEEAEYDEMYTFFVDYVGTGWDRFDEMTCDSRDPSEWLWDELQEEAIEFMQDYPLSIDDSHVWFTLGGPNISANVTGWSVDNDGRRVSVTALDITLKGRWGGDSVDVDLFEDSPTTGPAFRAIAEMFEMNLLLKFSAI